MQKELSARGSGQTTALCLAVPAKGTYLVLTAGPRRKLTKALEDLRGYEVAARGMFIQIESGTDIAWDLVPRREPLLIDHSWQESHPGLFALICKTHKGPVYSGQDNTWKGSPL